MSDGDSLCTVRLYCEMSGACNRHAAEVKLLIHMKTPEENHARNISDPPISLITVISILTS